MLQVREGSTLVTHLNLIAPYLGHEITATIAQMYLFDSTRNALCAVLPAYANCHLAPVAAWADKVKRAYRWSSAMHYVNGIGDHPGNHCVFGQQGWMGVPGVNVLGAIRNTSSWLQDGKDGAEEALKFFVHFMGDMHMPLHLTGRNKGGNGGETDQLLPFNFLTSIWFRQSALGRPNQEYESSMFSSCLISTPSF